MSTDARQLLGTVVRINGDLYEAIAITQDHDTVTFEKADRRGQECPTCGQRQFKTYVVGAPNFRSEVKPVRTMRGEED